MADSNTYKVLPDTGLVIGFQYSGRLARLARNELIQLDTAGISGLSDEVRTFKNAPFIGTVLVVFKEAGAAPFFKVPLHELFRESVSLDHFMLRSELLILEEQLNEAETDLQRIAVVEKFLLAAMRDLKPDQLVLKALNLLHQTHGTIRMKELAEQLNISQSPLEKRFRQVVGATPKKLASIIRMKHALKQYLPGKSLTALGYEVGFYDQSHFIKEFKLFTGETPEDFFDSNK